MKDIKHIRRDFHLAAWVKPQEWDLGVPWGVGGQFFFSEIQPDLVCEAHAPAQFFPGGGDQKFNFLNIVMWHIKLKWMSSRPGYIEIF